MRDFSILDVAPTIAEVLKIDIPPADGRAISTVSDWGCDSAILLIVDSLGYQLYEWLSPKLKNIPLLAERGLLLRARSVSNRTTPAIASILSGLLPEHHCIFDKQGAKESSILSLPEVASSQGLRSAVIMEKNGAEVYDGLIEIVRGLPDSLNPRDFDRASCRLTVEALSKRPKLLVSYFIGIDKAVHLGKEAREIREIAVQIDAYVGDVIHAAPANALIVICGDHPIHAGKLKRTKEPYDVALIMAKAGT
jgi:predicted AlkP superfamily pyrophosphatase or phosphodiesterase